MKPLSQMGRFATVVIDPPWKIGGFGWADLPTNNYERDLPYGVMSLREIKELPVADVLADDAFLFCWTINKFVRHTFDIVESWGASYSFLMSWAKPQGIQVPGGPMFNGEWCVIGRKGSPAYRDQRMFFTANAWPRGANSEKPEQFYDLLRRVTPEPRLDIFSRRRIPGFESWGGEAPEGPALPGVYQDVMF